MPCKMICCKDCGTDFTLKEGEQKFIKEKCLDEEPVRCPDCRRARNIIRNSSEYIFLMRSSERQNAI